MMYNDAAGNYNRVKSQTTTSKTQMLLMLYDGAIKFIGIAGEMIIQKDMPSKRTYISKTIAIINELNMALDFQAGGNIAEGLEMLYLYMVKRLTEANLKNDMLILKEVQDLLCGLRDTWEKAIISAAKEAAKAEAAEPEAVMAAGPGAKHPALSISI